MSFMMLDTREPLTEQNLREAEKGGLWHEE
ncbi:MAG: hypothetical protein H6Q72_4887 [Firmicutes bacterium]|nr:hypothetical protein [Bacillota bacterium]